MIPTKIVYPLEQVLEIKKKRVDEAQKILKQKQEALKREEEKLKQCEAERDKVLNHKREKLKQLRGEMEQKSTTSYKIQQMKDYLKVVDKKLEAEEKKVNDQKQQVKLAEEQVEIARKELKLKQLEVDKLETHKKNWVEMMKKELEAEEQKELDEIGSIIYTLRKRQE